MANRLRGFNLSRLFLSLCLALWLVGCRPAQEEPSFDVTIVVDGREEIYGLSRAVSVDELLASAGIELGPFDRISHPTVSFINDGMRITIRRVHEKRICERQEIPFERLLLPKEGLRPGARQLGQAGHPGIREACYQVIFEDEAEAGRNLVNDPIVVREAIDEIVYVGPINEVEPLAIAGRLSYINHKNAWTIDGNTTQKKALTASHHLDALVFHQSQDGQRLIFTSETERSDSFFNELWLIATTGEAEAMRLTPTDVLFAGWRPHSGNALAYSTGERSAGAAGWKALNNLWLMRIDLETGRTLSIEEVLPETSDGIYGWWGTDFTWSPHGDQLAWVQAEGFGLVDMAQKQRKPLGTYAVSRSGATWVWLSPISWSYDNQLIVSVVHGAPLGDEPPETSPIFNIAVTSADGRFSAPLKLAAGMWAAPSFSPNTAAIGAEYGEGYLAWLHARDPDNTMDGEYDLVIADRDGSNQRALFPPRDAPGIRKNGFGLSVRDFVWSPDARHIALIYQGDLWLVEVASGAAFQLTFDGGSSNPVWTG